MQWAVNKSLDFWWVHFHPISHFCSVVNHGKTKFVTLDYIVKKFSLFYDSPLIHCVTPALISWNIPKGKGRWFCCSDSPRDYTQEYFVEEKNTDICIWYSKIFQFSRMDPNGIYDIASSIVFSPLVFYDTRGCDCELEKKGQRNLFCECQADKLRVFLKLLPFQ